MLRVPRQKFVLAFTFLVAGTFFVGCSPIFVRWSELAPIPTAFHRVGLALPLFGIWYFWKSIAEAPKIVVSESKHGFPLAIFFAGFFFAGDLTFWHLSIVNTSIANATLLATLAPIYVTIGMFLLYREKPTKTFAVGMVLSWLGAVLLIGDNFSINPDNFLGDVYGLITGMFFGAYILAVGRARIWHSTAAVMAGSTLVSTLLLILLCVSFDQNLIAETWAGWCILLALALISQCLGQGLIASSLAYLPTAFSSVTLTLEAIFAAILAWIIFGETLGEWQWLGGVIIIAGIFLAQKGSANG